MSARTIIPAPTLFEKLLIISGLKKVRPSRTIEPVDQAVFISEIEAQAVRDVCKETGLDRFPRMLEKPEACPLCGKSILMMIEPVRVCFSCWPEVD